MQYGFCLSFFYNIYMLKVKMGKKWGITWTASQLSRRISGKEEMNENGEKIVPQKGRATHKTKQNKTRKMIRQVKKTIDDAAKRKRGNFLRKKGEYKRKPTRNHQIMSSKPSICRMSATSYFSYLTLVSFLTQEWSFNCHQCSAQSTRQCNQWHAQPGQL